MYSVETAKMSSKGQLVIPDVFRRNFGWKAGTTLLMIGTGNAVVLQSLQTPTDDQVDQIVAQTKAIGDSVARRVRHAKASLDRLGRLGIQMPLDAEKSENRRRILMEKHA